MSQRDEELLLDYAKHFLGYGSLSSRVWLIGPEAGGGHTPDELYKRAAIWADRGSHAVEDLQCYHRLLELPAKNDWSKNVQSTWGALIRILLAFEGKQPCKEDVLKFQKEELGRAGGCNAVLDLSQISSPTLSKWNAGGIQIRWLAERQNYEAELLQPRCDLLSEKIRTHEPSLVLFYGLRSEDWWKRVAGQRFSRSNLLELSVAPTAKTFFAMVSHPNGLRPKGKGAKNRLLAEIGTALRDSFDNPKSYKAE